MRCQKTDSLQNAADFLEDQSEGWLQRILEILDKLGLAVRLSEST